MLLLGSILLFILALVLFCILCPFGIIWALITSIRWKIPIKLYRYISNIFFSMAFALDLLGNVILAPFMNRWFITKESTYKFGSIKHTISLVIAYNYREKTLSRYGIIIHSILELAQKGHCEIAIQDFENIKFKNNPYNI